MDAFGYKQEDGNTWFSSVIINSEGKTLWLSGILGEVQAQFLQLGDEFSRETFETKTIPMLQGLGYTFDFNEKSEELMIRIPVDAQTDISNLRFQKVEPLVDAILKRSGNGFCDYGYVADGFLNMVPRVYSREVAVQTFAEYLPKAFGEQPIPMSIWTSEGGIAKEELWAFA